MNLANEYCEQKAARSGSSFYYSFRYLSPKQRQAITAVYAFCREVDDIADECTEVDIARRKLSWWYEEIQKLYTGCPQHPISQALAECMQNYNLDRALFEQILQGMHMDLSFQGYANFSDLKFYCHCVASTVGLLSVEIFGYKQDSTLEYAKNLGIALQLVNIIRDIGDDARRGRLYIPEDELEKFQVTPASILSLEYSENIANLLAYQAKRAKQYRDEAMLCLDVDDREQQISGLIMANIYFILLDEIAKLKYSVLNHKVCLTPIRKLWLAWSTVRKEKKLLQETV